MKKVKLKKNGPSEKIQPESNVQSVLQAKDSRFFEPLGLGIIILLGSLLYSNSFNCSFHLDDAINIVDNPDIRNLYDVKTWWNHNSSRPIPFFTFALNYHFGQYQVWGWHLFNLIIHLINAVLVWWLSTLMFSSPALKDHPLHQHKSMLALLTALLFVSHPLATQSVTYIVQRMASMVALFYMLSVALYMAGRLRENSSVSKYLLFAGSFGSAVLALLTKENAFTLPFAILLVEICFLNTKRLSINFKNKGILLLLAAASGVILFALMKYSVGNFFKPIAPDSVNDYRTITAYNYLLTQFSVIVKYIGLLLLPVHQNLDHDILLSNHFFELSTVLNFGLLLSLFLAGIFFFKNHRILSFGIFWFFLTLSIESSIIPISDLIFEHRTYLPSLGFFLILSSGIYTLLYDKNKSLALALFVLIIGSNSILTFQRNKVWKDDLTLWNDVVSKSPNKARGYNNRGSLLYLEKKYEQAIKDIDKAIALKPMYADAYYNRGVYFNNENKYEQAINDFNKAIALKPNYVDAYNNRGTTYNSMGKHELALKDFQKTLELNPKHTNAWFNCGNALQKMGESEKAIDAYSRVLELDPQYVKAYDERARALININKTAEALKDFDKAIEIDPGNVNVYNNRGTLHYQEKRYEAALSDYSKAITLKPDFAGAYFNRGATENTLGQKTAACQDLKQAADLGHQGAKDFFLQICN